MVLDDFQAIVFIGYPQATIVKYGTIFITVEGMLPDLVWQVLEHLGFQIVSIGGEDIMALGGIMTFVLNSCSVLTSGRNAGLQLRESAK
ncbi:hypothetical protein DSO57_1008348 [Entomophthora muscae]|uniref:Uncharacterized protein n=1 Tax=Entomophthora muscae TaxID=34485 RepID=A0ACC2S901_9FUNG|nr:hypothetical protein DSO57_1008348 [Entomophthora muscae]